MAAGALACLVDTAKVSSLDPPLTPADSAANQITAHFCSAGSSNASVAYFVVDILAGGMGKMKVVAIDPTDPDSSRVIISNEATFNGGIDSDYAPVVLRAASTRQGTTLQVAVVGTDLSTATSLSIGAADGVWNQPLSISSQSATSIVAAADVPTLLPEAVVRVGNSSMSIGVGALAPEEAEEAATTYPDTILFRDPNPSVYPKDFAFFYNSVPTGNAQHPWKGRFHLIYIRHLLNASGDAQEPCLAHAWSDSLRNWRVDTLAFLPGSGWDGLHVWAPSIIKVGNLYQMFYTGVDAGQNQRIGYATTSLLDTTNTTWTRRTSSVYSADSAASWADPTGAGMSGQQQFRDPFMMEDPDSAGRYLMFVTGEDKKFGADHRMIIGVARNAIGTLDSWKNLGAYRATDYTHNWGILRDESPMVMRDSAGTGAWRIFVTNASSGGKNSVYFMTENVGASLTDTTLAAWPGVNKFYAYLGADSSVFGWDALEHLQVGKAHFLAGYMGDGIGITQGHWDPSTGNFVIGYPSMAGVGHDGEVSKLRFYLAGYRPGSDAVQFALETPTRTAPRLVLYDLAGRRVRTLSDGRSILGRQEYRWDCRNAQGSRVASGVYFARLTGCGSQRVLRVAVVR